MRNIEIRKPKTYYINFLYIVLSAFVFYFVINSIYNNKIEDYKKNKIEELQLSYDVIINSYNQSMKIVYNEIINQPEILSILEDANSGNPEKVNKARQNLFSKLSPIYTRLKDIDVRQLHFHLPDNKSFLRFHRPLKYGDDLTDIRYSVKKTNIELKSHFGFEEGRIFNGFRYVFPIITSEKKHLGSVEISINFRVIEKELHKLFNKDYYFLIDKDIVNRKLFASEKSNYKQAFLHNKFMYESYVTISETTKIINKIIKNKINTALSEYTPIVIDCKCKDVNYIVSFYPIINVEGNESAYLVSYEKDNTIMEINRVYYIILFAILFFFIIILLLIFKLNRNNRRLIKNEEKLLKSELKFRSLFSDMSEGVFLHEIVYDNKGIAVDYRIIEANTASEKVLEIKISDAVGKLATELYRTKEAPFLKKYNKVVKTGKPIQFEQYFPPLKKYFYISVYSPEKNKFVTIFLDITKRKKAEKEIKKLSLAVEQSANVIVITDIDGNIEYVNPKFTELTGYTTEEAIGQNPRILNAGTQPKEYYVDMWKAISSGKMWKGEFHNKTKNGVLFWENVTITPIKNDDGIITNYLAIKENITAEKIASEALKQHAIQLQERNEDLDSFSHTVAHDLKNPLGNMMSFASLMYEDNNELSNDEIKKFLKIIIKSGEKTQQIINSLLLLAKVRKTEIVTQKIEMNTIVNSAINRLIQLKKEKNASIKLPEKWLASIGYPDWIEEVWVNYLSNALKYGGLKPEIELGYNIEKDNGKEAGQIRFWVKDFGKGISDENQKLLFSKFERLEQVEISGHGLGLSIVSNIINKLGGKVGVKSKIGEGSLFYFTLPAAIKISKLPVNPNRKNKNKNHENLNLGDKNPTSTIKTKFHSNQPESLNLKILIVEDESFAEKHLSVILKNISREILYANTGKQAVEISKSNKDIDLILMDIKMPIMDGYDATREIRKFNKDIIIIAQTAYAFAEDVNKAIEAGCDDYISKPIKKDMLLEIIKKQIKK